MSKKIKVIKVKSMLIGLVSLVLFTLASYGQDSDPPLGELSFADIARNITGAELERNSSMLNLEIELAKADFLLLEPVIVRVRISNPTNQVLKIYNPSLSKFLGMKTTINGQVEIDRKLFWGHVTGPKRVGILRSGEVIEKTVIFQLGDGLFNKVGNYEVQFFLSHLKEKKWSNTLNISVNSPEGVDKEAFDSLSLNLASKYNLFNLKKRDNAKAQNLLEIFIKKFNTSVYYEYAVLRLSNLYSETDQAEKAEQSLLEIKNTQNVLMKEIIEKRLSAFEEIRKRKQVKKE